jgi:hypothetical protein
VVAHTRYCTDTEQLGTDIPMARLLLQALDFPLLIQDQGHMLQHLLGVNCGSTWDAGSTVCSMHCIPASCSTM